jgi:tetratricopeptide (TPR) repeat protein
MGRYTECLAEAAQALKLRPGWAEAYGNISAAFLGMNRWDEGIQAARQALLVNPNYQAARNNLRWALEHKPK